MTTVGRLLSTCPTTRRSESPWRKKVHAENQQDADSYNTKTDPQITPTDKVVALNANIQGAGDKGVTDDMDMYVPRILLSSLPRAAAMSTITGTTRQCRYQSSGAAK